MDVLTTLNDLTRRVIMTDFYIDRSGMYIYTYTVPHRRTAFCLNC